MGGIAGDAIDLSTDSFSEGINVTEKVRSLSELLVTMSVDVEDKVFELIAKYQPVASDLRIIKSYMKIAYDLERYGRYAWDISFTHQKLDSSRKRKASLPIINEMMDKVNEMVHISIEALKRHDSDLAQQLIKLEKSVDETYLKFLEALGKDIQITRSTVSDILIIRYLERIADHATYIGEAIIYIATGKKIVLR
jgi:phosphate transport system protein